MMGRSEIARKVVECQQQCGILTWSRASRVFYDEVDVTRVRHGHLLELTTQRVDVTEGKQSLDGLPKLTTWRVDIDLSETQSLDGSPELTTRRVDVTRVRHGH